MKYYPVDPIVNGKTSQYFNHERYLVCFSHETKMSRGMRFPTILYVQPAKPQIRLCIHTV